MDAPTQTKRIICPDCDGRGSKLVAIVDGMVLSHVPEPGTLVVNGVRREPGLAQEICALCMGRGHQDIEL